MEIKIQDSVRLRSDNNMVGTVIDRFIQNIEFDANSSIEKIEASQEDPAYLIEFPHGDSKVLNASKISLNRA